MMSENQSAKRKRKQSVKDLKCENLTIFKESLEPSWNFINVFLNDGKKRLTRGMLRKLNEQNATDSTNRKSLLSNSAKILSKTIEQAMVIIDKDNRDDQDASIIECSPKSSLPLQQILQREKLPKFLNKKKNRSSIILINNDLSDASRSKSTDIHECSIHESIPSSSNGENIAPQKEDDIIELWSNLETNKGKKDTFKKCKYNEMNEDICFIDTKPDLKNLDCLQINTESASKKRKLHKRDKNFKQDQEWRQHNNNTTHSTIKSIKKEKKKKRKCPASNDNSSSTASLVRNVASSSAWNSAANSISNPTSDSNPSSNKLREIIVDGSNVARAYTHDRKFSEKGIQLVVDYFMTKGHVVKVFLPLHIRRKEYSFLEEMYKKGVVVFTPSRRILGRQITPYDDRYILEYATSCEGIVVSADQYRDLYDEKPEWRDTIANRLLTPTFVGDCVMFPDDPLGRFGPNLHTFLRH